MSQKELEICFTISFLLWLKVSLLCLKSARCLPTKSELLPSLGSYYSKPTVVVQCWKQWLFHWYFCMQVTNSRPTWPSAKQNWDSGENCHVFLRIGQTSLCDWLRQSSLELDQAKPVISKNLLGKSIICFLHSSWVFGGVGDICS